MKILVTGARGFIGKNLCAQLNNIKEGKARNYPVVIDEVMEYDRGSSPEELDRLCREADFVFNLAGVNRPADDSEFMTGNFRFASELLDALRRHGNHCPVMLASSVQASLTGRYAMSEYGRSKLAAEELFFRYAAETGARVLVYRFPNVFGKWCRPDYNSAVATFCHNIARGLPVRVDDPSQELELVYIDNVVDEMIAALAGSEHRCEFDGAVAVMCPDGPYCAVPVSHRTSLGRIVELLQSFSRLPLTHVIPEIPAGSFAWKLYSAYLSYLPAEKVRYGLNMNVDSRGSFTELLRTAGSGQMSVNVSGPGITKGGHWHNSKWELFIVVSGHGLIRMRREGTGEVLEFEVSGDKIEAVHILPGYTHDIINLSDTQNLVTVMWANEPFDSNRPDTYSDPVK